jgi:hypothetical protein
VLAILTEENNAGLLEGTQYGTHYDPTNNTPHIPPRPNLDSLRPIAAADEAFANQPGLLRQQITTDPVASGSQPILYTGSDAAPDRVDATID